MSADWWLKLWAQRDEAQRAEQRPLSSPSSTSSPEMSGQPSSESFLLVFAALTGVVIILGLFQSLLLFFVGLRASTRIHDAAFHGLDYSSTSLWLPFYLFTHPCCNLPKLSIS